MSRTVIVAVFLSFASLAHAQDLATAERLVNVGKLADAEAAYRLTLDKTTKDPVTHDLIAAYEGLRRVLVAQGKSDALVPVLADLVDAYWKAGDRELTEQRFDELLLLDPTHARRGELETLLGRIAPQDSGPTPWTERLRSFFGLFVIMGIGFVFSTNRRAVSLRLVLWGLALQFTFAVIVLWTPPGRAMFDAATVAVNRIIAFSDDGASFLFGRLYNGLGPSLTRGPYQLIDGTTGEAINIGLVFAMHVLPTIVFIGALMSVLYHWNVIQVVVRGIAWVMERTMGTSGAESLSTAINIFVGQTEAPLVVKPYISKMTQSELMAVMVGGFATVAGGVLAAYVRFGIDAGHLVAASFMGAPATLVIAKIMLPETEVPLTQGGKVQNPPKLTRNVIDAAAAGASEGVQLAINVAAMLVAFIALVAMMNWALGFVGVSLRDIFGWLFYPLSWCMGVPTKDLVDFGSLMGTKISLNEFVAYLDLGNMQHRLSPRTVTIATYALCGFANFSSIGIQIGGIGGMAPERRGDIAAFGLRAMFAGALASCMTACVAGLLI